MEAGFIILVAMVTIIAIIAGIFIGKRIEKSRVNNYVSKGFIYVSNDDGSQPDLFLQCTVPIEDIASCKQVLFDVTVL